MKKVLSAFLAIMTIAGALAVVVPAAQADGGRIAAGVAGGLIGGALLGGAIANAGQRPYYAAPAPVYIEEEECHWVRERFWDGYGWRHRRVRVCE